MLILFLLSTWRNKHRISATCPQHEKWKRMISSLTCCGRFVFREASEAVLLTNWLPVFPAAFLDQKLRYTTTEVSNIAYHTHFVLKLFNNYIVCKFK